MKNSLTNNSSLISVLGIMLFIALTQSVWGQMPLEVETAGNEYAKLYGGSSPSMKMYSNGQLLGELGHVWGGQLDLSLATSSTSGAAIHLHTGFDNTLTLDAQGNTGIGTRNPSAKLEVVGYTKLGSGDGFPAIKLKRIETISTDASENLVPHGLANGWKIQHIFARAAMWDEDIERWYYEDLPIKLWTDQNIHVKLTPITELGFSRPGHFIQITVIYADQGNGED